MMGGERNTDLLWVMGIQGRWK